MGHDIVESVQIAILSREVDQVRKYCKGEIWAKVLRRSSLDGYLWGEEEETEKKKSLS